MQTGIEATSRISRAGAVNGPAICATKTACAL
jgi:hypothetical protein